MNIKTLLHIYTLRIVLISQKINLVNGTFTKLPWLYNIETTQLNYGVAVSNIDNDGDLEWIVAGFSGGNFVLKIQ